MDQTLEFTVPFVTTHFEACTEYRGDHHDADCEHCGWLEVDHVAMEHNVLAVFPVPRHSPMPLRRAS